jgi:hypothetical protein
VGITCYSSLSIVENCVSLVVLVDGECFRLVTVRSRQPEKAVTNRLLGAVRTLQCSLGEIENELTVPINNPVLFVVNQ